jgi:hypothetical protein
LPRSTRPTDRSGDFAGQLGGGGFAVGGFLEEEDRSQGFTGPNNLACISSPLESISAPREN